MYSAPATMKRSAKAVNVYCAKCKIYILMSSVVNHTKSARHTGKRACMKCDYSAASISELGVHMQRVHGITSNTSSYYYYQCLACDLPLRSICAVETHSNTLGHVKKLKATTYDRSSCIVERKALKDKKTL